MLNLEKIIVFAAAVLVASPSYSDENLPEGFKEERIEMPKLSGPYTVFPVRWETLPDNSIRYVHESESMDSVTNYVEARHYNFKEGDSYQEYRAFFRICNKVKPKLPYYVIHDKFMSDDDLQVFVDNNITDGITELTGIIKRTPDGVSPAYDYYKKHWDSFIPPCKLLISNVQGKLGEG